MGVLQLPDADPADIIIIVRGGVMVLATAPPGLSVQFREYDGVTRFRNETEPSRDEAGTPCKVTWLKEPGEANREEMAPCK